MSASPRIDRVLDPAFVEDLDSLESADLRRRLQEARAEEDRLSYRRRVLHAQMDIARAELERRSASAGDVTAEETVERLKYVLGRGEGGSRGARPRVSSPLDDEPAFEDLLARLPDMSADQVTAAVDRLIADEQPVSEQRRSLFAVIDALEHELVGRYQSGSVSPADVLGQPPER